MAGVVKTRWCGENAQCCWGTGTRTSAQRRRISGGPEGEAEGQEKGGGQHAIPAFDDYRWPTGPHGTALALARPGTARQGTAWLGTVEDPCRAC